MKNNVFNVYTESPMFPVRTRVNIDKYHEWSMEVFEKYNIKTPYKSELTRPMMDSLSLRMLVEEYVVFFEYKGVKYRLIFKKGFIYDLASTPKAFRSLVENDDIIVEISALVHDALFGLHLFSFHESNEIFYGITKHYQKKYRPKRRMLPYIYYRGVESVFGRKVYNNEKPEEHWNFGKVILENFSAN